MSFDELYIINDIKTNSGVLQDVHKQMLGKECKLSDLKCGYPAIISVVLPEEREKGFITSRVESVSSDSYKSSIAIRTKNTLYMLNRVVYEGV